MALNANKITLIPTKDLPVATESPSGAITNIYDPNDAKDKQIELSKLFTNPVFNRVDFNPQTPTEQPYKIGRIFYDSTEGTWTAYNDIEGTSLQLGEELRARLNNDTGGTLLNGAAISIVGSVGLSLKVELADASDQDSSIRGYGLMTTETINGNPGYAVTYGAVRNLDTSSFIEGDVIYVDPATPGALTNIRPKAPYYPIRIGICLFSDASNGVIAVSTLAFNGNDTSVNIEGTLNGIVLDTPNIVFSVSGGVIYADVTNEQYPTRKLPVIFSDHRYDLDTLTGSGSGGAARVVIPQGTSTTLLGSLIYIYLDNGVPTLGVSQVEPNVPYSVLARVGVFDAARTLSEGKVFAYRRSNNSTDRLDGVHDGSYGLFEEILFWARTLGSSWLSGLDATPTVNNTTIRVALTGGTGRQFRRANLPSFDGLSYRIFNDVNNVSGNYPITDNLTSITTTAGGTTDNLLSNNRFYTIRLFYQLNSNGIGNHIIATRPTGYYTTAQEAINDANNYAVNFNDPSIEEVVFPIYDLVIGRTGTGGTTITLVKLTDRRSKLPFTSGGGGATGGGGTDNKVGITSADTTPSYLNDKLIGDDDVKKTIINPSANEQIQLSLSKDTTPTASSTKTVTSGGIQTALNNIPYDVNNNNTLLVSGRNYALSGADGACSFLLPSVLSASNRINVYIVNATDVNTITINGNGNNIEGASTYVFGSSSSGYLYEFVVNSNDGEWKVRQLDRDYYDISFALSDETSDLTTDNDAEIEVIRSQTIESITFSVNIAPVGSSVLVDVLKNGTTILTGAITLPASSKTVTITPPQISNTSIAVGDIIKADITQIGATTAGSGAKMYIKTKVK